MIDGSCRLNVIFACCSLVDMDVWCEGGGDRRATIAITNSKEEAVHWDLPAHPTYNTKPPPTLVPLSLGLFDFTPFTYFRALLPERSLCLQVQYW
jgi:hypothetical protein